MQQQKLVYEWRMSFIYISTIWTPQFKFAPIVLYLYAVIEPCPRVRRRAECRLQGIVAGITYLLDEMATGEPAERSVEE